MGCHGEDGMGLAGQVPAIRVTLAPILSTAAGREYVLRVPGIAQSSLASRELAEVLNWITREYSAPAALQRIAPFEAAEVERLRQQPLLDVSAARARLNLQSYGMVREGRAAPGARLPSPDGRPQRLFDP
jgi:hypothetical protein